MFQHGGSPMRAHALRPLLAITIAGVAWAAAEAHGSSARGGTVVGRSRNGSPVRCDCGNFIDESPARDGILERLFRLPGRRVGADRDGFRSPIRRRVQQRIKEETRWVAAGGSVWYTDYATAYRSAERERKLLLVYFFPEVDE